MRASPAYHVVRLPLRVTKRDARLLREQCFIVGQLRNAVLRDAVQRVLALKRDLEWGAARSLPQRERQGAYRGMIEKHELRPFDLNQLACEHWRASKWMPGRIGSRIALALAREVHQNVSEWLYGRAQRPRPKHPRTRTTVWNNDSESGLLYRDEALHWSIATRHKSLHIPVDFTGWSRKRRDWLARQRIARAGVQREQVRGWERWFVLLCVKAPPYRSEEYLDSVQHAFQGLDLGPSRVALVSQERAEIIPLIAREELEAEREARKLERRRQRAVQRSRRASNPEAFNKDGSSKKGVKQRKLSKRGKRRAARLATSKRKRTIHRRQRQQRVIREIVSRGSTIAAEDLDYRAWQRSWGARTSLTAPGEFMQRLAAECARVGGGLKCLDPWALALSQYCLCGERAKKALSEREHSCPVCGFGPVDRDLLAAFLAREVAVKNLSPEDLSDGLDTIEDGIRDRAERVLRPSARHHSSDQQASSRDRVVNYCRSERSGSRANDAAMRTSPDSRSTPARFEQGSPGKRDPAAHPREPAPA